MTSKIRMFDFNSEDTVAVPFLLKIFFLEDFIGGEF